DGSGFGLGVLNATINRNAYTGTEAITAAYAMVDMKVAPKLRLLAGARLEITDIEVISQDENIDPGVLDNTDILPALNLTYELKENMNLRFAYSRTLARPVFREIAPFESFEFVGDYNKAGNPELERTTIDNLDLRWEVYPNPGELITLSAFYKNFNDPIEFAILSQAQGSNRTIQPRNSPSANAFGFEIEIRKRLDFISESLANFSIGGNFSYNFTEVTIDSTELAEDRAIDPNAEDTRRLYAQSPYVVNAFLNYDNYNIGLSANLNFNVFGERLSAIGPEGTPDVFEQPRPTLDFTVAKDIGEKWNIRFRARNLINPDYEQIYEYLGVEYIFNSYQIGRTFSLSVKYLID
ncbi:MAG: TonB-dependent receptor, partial [Bacteroidota bacterium]